MATALAAPAATRLPQAPPAAPPAHPRPPRRRTWAGAYAAWALLQAAQLAALFALDRRFFWLDDSQSQFGPTVRYLGTTMTGGRPPLTDPELGMAGDFATDMQYGALDPLHWAWAALAARTDDVLVMAWVFGATCVAMVGAGSLWVLLRSRVRPALAVPAAVGLATGGFFLWYGSAWWPLLWSVAWLPWIWVGIASRRWPGAVVAGVATWGLVASGNPYAVPFAVLVVAGLLAEEVRRRRSALALLAAPVLARVVACTGGVLLALPTVLATLETTPAVVRQGAEAVVGNAGFGVPNALDVAVGGATLLGATNAWAGDLERAPSMAALLVALPLLALVRWRVALRAPGVPTAALVAVAALVATQLPTTVALFRYPLRYTVVVQLFGGLLAVLAVTAAPLLTRRRLAVAGGLVALQGALALSRAPVFWRWHALAALVAAAALAAAVLLLRRRRPLPLVALVLAAACASPPLVGVAMMTSLAERVASASGAPLPAAARGLPYRELPAGYEQGTTTAEYRARAYAPGEAFTLYKTDPERDRGWASGIQGGSSNLLADMRVGTGSFAVWQRALNAHLPRDYQGNLYGDPAQWLATAPGTGLPWADVAASSTVVVQDSAPEPLLRYFRTAEGWRQVDDDGTWSRFERTSPLPGRLTAVTGAQVSPEGVVADLGRSGGVQDAWTVSTGDAPGRLVTRITDWPGHTATLDGRPLPLSSVDGALLAVDLPAGLDGARVELRYAPLGDRLLWPLVGAGAALIAVGAALPLLWVPLLRRGEAALAARAGAAAGTGAGRAAADALLGQVAKFFLGSCLGLAVDLGVFSAAIAAGAPPWAANALSSACAVVTTYAAVTRYAFRARASRATFVAFVAWYALSIVAFSALIDGLVALTAWAPLVCKVITLPLSFAANYAFSRRIFRERDGR